ncbi:carbohydrate ABC transporter permease, partial [Paenibacillus sp. 28ISP30-2]|nr:carbohydrate ABC transporter permease [Paenibacillus sp. 28ISP30-2]
MAWKTFKWPIYHILVAALALLMLYPVFWMLFSSFKKVG